jgi:hypothetical protein
VPQILFGSRYESFELIFLTPDAVDDQVRVVAKISNVFGSNPERHSSPSCGQRLLPKLGG